MRINLRSGYVRVAQKFLYMPLAVLQVRDDGPGFDVEASNGEAQVGGLMSMKRRAEVIGGTLDIASAPGQGTFLTVRVSHPGNDWPRAIKERLFNG